MGSLTSEGKLTSLEPLGWMYASISLVQSSCTYSLSFAGGASPSSAFDSIFA